MIEIKYNRHHNYLVELWNELSEIDKNEIVNNLKREYVINLLGNKYNIKADNESTDDCAIYRCELITMLVNLILPHVQVNWGTNGTDVIVIELSIDFKDLKSSDELDDMYYASDCVDTDVQFFKYVKSWNNL